MTDVYAAPSKGSPPIHTAAHRQRCSATSIYKECKRVTKYRKQFASYTRIFQVLSILTRGNACMRQLSVLILIDKKRMPVMLMFYFCISCVFLMTFCIAPRNKAFSCQSALYPMFFSCVPCRAVQSCRLTGCCSQPKQTRCYLPLILQVAVVAASRRQ